MNYKKSSEISEQLLSKIISVAYGNGSLIDKFQVKRLINKDFELKELYEEYRRTAEAVHSLYSEKYEHESAISPHELKSKPRKIIDDIYSIFLGKPIISSAVVTVLLISIMFSVFNEREISFNGYTLAEVEKADIDSRHAISIVANIFKNTGKTLKTDILYKEVSVPIRSGINTVNKLFNKEIKK